MKPPGGFKLCLSKFHLILDGKKQGNLGEFLLWLNGNIPVLSQWVKDLVWLWHRLVATAGIRPLAWEFPYALGMTLKRKKKKRQDNLGSLSLLFNSIFVTFSKGGVGDRLQPSGGDGVWAETG